MDPGRECLGAKYAVFYKEEGGKRPRVYLFVSGTAYDVSEAAVSRDALVAAVRVLTRRLLGPRKYERRVVTKQENGVSIEHAQYVYKIISNESELCLTATPTIFRDLVIFWLNYLNKPCMVESLIAALSIPEHARDKIFTNLIGSIREMPSSASAFMLTFSDILSTVRNAVNTVKMIEAATRILSRLGQ